MRILEADMPISPAVQYHASKVSFFDEMHE
jgi:hypothetical protein